MSYTRQMETALARGLKIRVLPTYDAMSRAAVDLISGELRRRPDMLLCLSAGGTPTRTYELLAASRRDSAVRPGGGNGFLRSSLTFNQEFSSKCGNTC